MINTLNWQVKLSFGLLIIALCLLGFSAPVLADDHMEAVPEQFEELEGVEVETPEKPVTGFRMFWSNVRDNVSLALTFDDVKKAEKELKYAEKRIRWANTLAESSDEEAQERALKLSAKADEYMAKIEARKEKILEKADEKSIKLLENVAKHQANKMKVWDKLEAKIPAEKLEAFSAIRERVEGNEKRFLENVLQHDKVPAEVKEKLGEKKIEIEARLQNRQTFVEEHRELLDRVKDVSEEDLERVKNEIDKRREEAEAAHRQRIIEAHKMYKERLENGEVDLQVMPAEREDMRFDANLAPDLEGNTTRPQVSPRPRPSVDSVNPGIMQNSGETPVSTDVKPMVNSVDGGQAQPMPSLQHREIKRDYQQFLKDLDSSHRNR